MNNTTQLHTDALGYTYELVELQDLLPNLYERRYKEPTPDGQYVVLAVSDNEDDPYPGAKYYMVALFDEPFRGVDGLGWGDQFYDETGFHDYDKALAYIKSLYS